MIAFASSTLTHAITDHPARRLEASKSFPASFNQKVDLRKVQLQVIKPWIENRVQELLGFEDDVVSEYVVGQLESDAMSPVSVCRRVRVLRVLCLT